MSRLGQKCGLLLIAGLAGCGRTEVAGAPRSHDPGPRPDSMPTLVSGELPFRYPGALYAQKVQGNVTLRLFVDRDGRVAPESTRVDEPSGNAALDSAAASGSSALRFVPAKLNGAPIPTTILFPVYFRHPEARPLPGDTIFAAAARRPGDG